MPPPVMCVVLIQQPVDVPPSTSPTTVTAAPVPDVAQHGSAHDAGRQQPGVAILGEASRLRVAAGADPPRPKRRQPPRMTGIG